VDRTWTDAATGATVMKWLTRTVDPAEQMLHVTLIYDEVAPDGVLRRTLARMTCAICGGSRPSCCWRRPLQA